MVDIDKLLNKGRWGEIIKLVKNKKIDPLKPIINDNTVTHLAAANNNSSLLTLLAKQNPDSLKKLNGDGQSALHILINYGYKDLLMKLLRTNKDLINTNNINQDSLLSLIEDNETFSWIVKNCNVDFSIRNQEGFTILDKNISKCKKKGDNYYKNIKTVLNRLPLNESVNNPLISAIESGNKDVALLILKNDTVDINVHNRMHITPLVAAIKNNMYDVVDILISKGAHLNNVFNQDDNPLNLLVLRSDETNNSTKMIDMLIKHGFDPNKHNRYKDTPLHMALQLDKKLPDSLIFMLMYYTDINKINLNGDTTLHLLLKKQNWYDWKHYDALLKTKDMDIFKRNNENKMVINYVKNNDISLFIDTVANSYINSSKYCKNRIGLSDNLKFKQCLEIVKEHIFKSNRSYPTDDDIDKMSKQFKIVDGKETNEGKFNSDTIHNILYTLLILQRYKNVGVPFQSYTYDKLLNDKIVETYTDMYRIDNFGIYVTDITRLYTDLFYELLPYLIVWKSSTEYFIHNDIEFYLQKCFASDKIRFIFLKLTMIPSASGTVGTHANVLIFDKETGIFERFEPYGYVPNLEPELLDKMLENVIGGYFTKYLKKINKKLLYLKPNDYMDGLSFQTFSNDSDTVVKKLGDPFGYCLAWSFWYLEMRFTNPDTHPRDIIRMATNNIINSRNDNTKFIDFIRNYAKDLYDLKNKLLLDAGIKNDNINNLVFELSDHKLITDYMLNNFKAIVSERY